MFFALKKAPSRKSNLILDGAPVDILNHIFGFFLKENLLELKKHASVLKETFHCKCL
jgi:hypothetical protein